MKNRKKIYLAMDFQKVKKHIWFISCIFIAFTVSLSFVIVYYALKYNNTREFRLNTLNVSDTLNSFMHNNKIIGAVKTIGVSSYCARESLQDRSEETERKIYDTLVSVQKELGASIVYIMDAEGTVIACSPYGPDNKTLKGNNYGFRPYFQKAMEGQTVIYPGLGVTTNQRGLYFSSPVYSSCNSSLKEYIGVVVVKMDLTEIDEFLDRIPGPAALVSPSGIVFSSNQKDWLFKKIRSVNQEKVKKALKTRQFSDLLKQENIETIPIDLDKTQIHYGEKTFAVESAYIDLLDETGIWRIVCLGNVESWYSAWIFILVAGIIILPGCLVSMLLVNAIRKMHTERSLEEKQKLYRLTFEYASDSYITLDGETIIDFNDSTLENLRCKKKDIVGKKITEIAPFEKSKDFKKPDYFKQKIIEVMKKQSLCFEWKANRFDGSVFDAEITLNRIALEGRNYIQVMMRDVTERKRILKVRQAAKERLDQIIAASPVPTFVLDKDHKITHWNKACQSLMSITSKEMIGTSNQWKPFYKEKRQVLADMLIDRKPQDVLLDTYGSTCKLSPLCDNAYETEAFFPHLGEGGKWLLGTAAPLLDTEGNIIGAIESLQDITESKHYVQQLTEAKEDAAEAWALTEAANRKLELEAEKARMLAEQAMSASKAKSEFLANMSHEIRTPMNSIIGFADILLDEELTEDQKNYAESICTSGKHLLDVIDDVLDFSKIEAGKLTIEKIECDLKELLTSIETLTGPVAARVNLELKITADEDVPAVIYTDPSRIRQCLVNLIGNSIKFTEKGYIHLHVSHREIADNSIIQFDVTDTGIGIDGDKLEHIFESFSQADYSTTRKYGGTGLGLAITKQLAVLLGGDISVKSTLGKGSTFSMAIPAGISTKKQQLTGPFSNNEGYKCQNNTQKLFSGSILIAEDTKANQDLMIAILERRGIKPVIVEDGRSAIDMATSNNYDLIFMDIQMPNVNGLEATTEIRAAGITTPIVAVTAYAMKGDNEKCIEVGCNDYLTKPINQQDLQGILSKYLDSQDDQVDQRVDQLNQQMEEINQICMEGIMDGKKTPKIIRKTDADEMDPDPNCREK